MFNYWFVSRQKRQLTAILQSLVAFSDVCVGEVWDNDLQIKFEDVLGSRSITGHGKLRARRSGQGGGGARTLFKQMKDLGLVFLEDDNRKCRLTLIGEELVTGKISFVDAMRMQLQRYQYPSATTWSGSSKVDPRFRVHPFQFMFRLLRDQRLGDTLKMEEMFGIVIHKADSDSNAVFEDVVQCILRYRQGITKDFVDDTSTNTYSNIANTFFNYIDMTQYTDRGAKTLSIRKGKEALVDEFLENSPKKLIPNPKLTENYQRNYGRGKSQKDLRDFSRKHVTSRSKVNEERICHEYVLLALRTPITGITPDIVEHISNNTGINETIVERFLIQKYPHGNIDDFFLAYKEYAHMGKAGAKSFEVATCEMFRKIFNMEAVHVGPRGNTPDVFVKSEDAGFCGIIDNKAYKNGYSITGDHKRVMEDVYIPNYKTYGNTNLPLAFFTYIAGSFGNRINRQIAEINEDTCVNGSAMPVDIFINIAQDYAVKGYNHQFLKKIFGVNRVVQLSDLVYEE